MLTDMALKKGHKKSNKGQGGAVNAAKSGQTPPSSAPASEGEEEASPSPPPVRESVSVSAVDKGAGVSTSWADDIDEGVIRPMAASPVPPRVSEVFSADMDGVFPPLVSGKRARKSSGRLATDDQGTLASDEEGAGLVLKRLRPTTAPDPKRLGSECGGSMPLSAGSSAPPPLDSIRVRVHELQKEMAAYCLDDSKKINKAQMAVITGKFREMGSLTSDLLLRVARLEGQLQGVLAARDGRSTAAQHSAAYRADDASMAAPTYASRLKSTRGANGSAAAPPPPKGGVGAERGQIQAAQKKKSAGAAVPRCSLPACPPAVPTAGAAPAPTGSEEDFRISREQWRRLRRNGVVGAYSGPSGAAPAADGRWPANTGPATQRSGARPRVVPQPPTPAVLIRPICADGPADSGATLKAIMDALNPVRDGIQVSGLRRRRDGGVLVQSASPASIQKVLSSAALTEKGLVASIPEGRDPELILMDVDRESSPEEVVGAIYALNHGLSAGLTEAEFGQRFRLCRRTGPRRDDLVHWVVSLSPLLHSRAMAAGRLYVGWRRCAVRSSNSVVRCHRCQAYGHVEKHCQDAQDTCGHCAQKGHRITSCPRKAAGAPPVCAACRRAGGRGGHSGPKWDCPAYLKALGRQLGRLNTLDNEQTQ